MTKSALPCTATIAALLTVLFTGADWPRFLGPGASTVADDASIPTRWSATENVVWKTALPGAGASSPITCGNRIFLGGYSGYGLDQDKPGEQGRLRHHLLCIDRKDGKILWDRQTEARLPETEYRSYVALHGYASGTPVTDGRAVYAFFGRSGVVAHTLSGRKGWHADVGSKTHSWGSGASPVIYKNMVIVNASVESESLVALNKRNGKVVWRVPGIRQSWSTPLVVDLPGGRHELVVSMHSKVLGLDPDTGRKLWECANVEDYVCPSVIADNGIVYVTGGRKPLTIAIRAGGRGDVTDTHLLWELKKTPKVPTPLIRDGLLCWVSNRGVATCVRADSGEVVYEKRLSGAGRVYASLVAAGGNLYAFTRQNGAFVLAAGPSFKQIAHNHLGDTSIFNGTPVVSNGQLLVRSDRFLYCIGR